MSFGHGCAGINSHDASDGQALPAAVQVNRAINRILLEEREDLPSLQNQGGRDQAENALDNQTLDQGGEPVVERGTGRVVAQLSSSPEVGVERDEAGAVTLNVIDADIRDVVRLVLAEGLGGNYVIDPAVTGTVTVRTTQPVPADDMIAILSSVLNLNGAALVEENNLYKIVPIEKISHRSAKVQDGAAGIQVSPLRYADAAQLAELLEPIAASEEGGQASVEIDAVRNTLVLAGTPDQIETMTDLIDMFDVDWMAGMSFGLYPLNEVNATQLATELETIFGDLDDGNLMGGLRLVPLNRLSALMVIAVQPEMLERAETWIKRLDKIGDGEQIHIYEVQHGRVTDIAAVLGELFDAESTVIGEDTLLAPGEEPIELGSSFEDTSTDGNELDLEGQGGGDRLDEGSDHASSSGQRSLSQGQTSSTSIIVADENSNSIFIRSTAMEYRRIRPALLKLDKQPLQVLLGATILEVSLEDELSYGVQWFLGSGNSNITLSETDSGSVSSIFPGFSGILSSGDVDAVVSALDSVSEINVVSSPQLLVLDNQTAELEVGDEVPIITVQSESTDDDNDSITSTVEQRQTGVILNVTPRVNASGLVVLDIQQEVSDVLETVTSGIDSPTISQRRISTSVAVSGEQTVVLGGLIQDNAENFDSGVPFLKDLPYLGVLFGGTTKITGRTELLVLITPKVLTNSNEAVSATNELRDLFWNLDPLYAKVQKTFRPPQNPTPSPLLPQPQRAPVSTQVHQKPIFNSSSTFTPSYPSYPSREVAQ